MQYNKCHFSCDVYLDIFFLFYYSRKPLALFHNTKHPVLDVSIDLTKGKLLTCGSDRIVKVRTVKNQSIFNSLGGYLTM